MNLSPVENNQIPLPSPPHHKWTCCFCCKCGEILNSSEQKVIDAVEFDRIRRQRQLETENRGRRRGFSIELPKEPKITPDSPEILRVPPAPIISPIISPEESPSSIHMTRLEITRMQEIRERNLASMKLE